MISGANALGFLLGGVLLDVVPVRATVAAAGVFGLVVTAAAAVPMLRAAARERAVATEGPGTAPGSVAALALAELQPAA